MTEQQVAEKVEAQEIQVKQDQLPQAQVNESSAILTVIERMATMPDLDMDRVERMFALHEKQLDRQAEQQFNEAMAKAQGEIQSVVKNKKGENSRYATLDAIHDAAKPIWTKYGLSVVSHSGRSDLDGHVKISCDVRHSAGHKESYVDDWPLDTHGPKGAVVKTPIQGKGSTTSYARRYTELMIFDISTNDDDDGAGAKTKPGDQPLTDAMLKNLRDAMLVAGVSEAKMCEKAEVDKVEDIIQSNMQRCKTWLQKVAQGKTNA